jgi:hypothetical protein
MMHPGIDAILKLYNDEKDERDLGQLPPILIPDE